MKLTLKRLMRIILCGTIAKKHEWEVAHFLKLFEQSYCATLTTKTFVEISDIKAVQTKRAPSNVH